MLRVIFWKNNSACVQRLHFFTVAAKFPEAPILTLNRTFPTLAVLECGKLYSSRHLSWEQETWISYALSNLPAAEKRKLPDSVAECRSQTCRGAWGCFGTDKEAGGGISWAKKLRTSGAEGRKWGRWILKLSWTAGWEPGLNGHTGLNRWGWHDPAIGRGVWKMDLHGMWSFGGKGWGMLGERLVEELARAGTRTVENLEGQG